MLPFFFFFQRLVQKDVSNAILQVGRFFPRQARLPFAYLRFGATKPTKKGGRVKKAIVYRPKSRAGSSERP